MPRLQLQAGIDSLPGHVAKHQGWMLRLCLSSMNRVSKRPYRPRDSDVREIMDAIGISWDQEEPEDGDEEEASESEVESEDMEVEPDEQPNAAEAEAVRPNCPTDEQMMADLSEAFAKVSFGHAVKQPELQTDAKALESKPETDAEALQTEAQKPDEALVDAKTAEIKTSEAMSKPDVKGLETTTETEITTGETKTVVAKCGGSFGLELSPAQCSESVEHTPSPRPSISRPLCLSPTPPAP